MASHRAKPSVRPVLPLALSPMASSLSAPASPGHWRADVWNVLALTGCYGASSLPPVILPTDQGFFTLRYALVGGSVFYLFWKSWRSAGRRGISLRDPLYLTWCGFGFCSLLAGAANDLNTFLQALWLLFGVPLFFYSLLPHYLGARTGPLLCLALAAAFTGFNLVSVVAAPGLSYPYSGVWANSNYIGILAATQAAGLLGLLPGVLEYSRWRVFVIPVAGLIVAAVALILLSGSRTSLLAFCVPFVLLVALWVRRKGPRVLLTLGAVAAAGVLVIGALGMQESAGGVAQGILNKQERQQHNVLSGRGEVWMETIRNARWLGHGFGYFPSTFGIGPHNVVIGILGNYGIPAAILFALFGALSMRRAWQYALRRMPKDAFAAAPMIVVAAFWTLAMGEASGALGGGLSLAFSTAVGVLLNPGMRAGSEG